MNALQIIGVIVAGLVILFAAIILVVFVFIALGAAEEEEPR